MFLFCRDLALLRPGRLGPGQSQGQDVVGDLRLDAIGFDDGEQAQGPREGTGGQFVHKIRDLVSLVFAFAPKPLEKV